MSLDCKHSHIDTLSRLLSLFPILFQTPTGTTPNSRIVDFLGLPKSPIETMDIIKFLIK